MIICHQYRFIFIKTRKTAGSSVEIALSRLCQLGDIVTPLSAERGEETLRQQEGGYGPTGHLKPVLEHKGLKEWRRLLFRGKRSHFGVHMSAEEIQSLVDSKIWDSYLKIAIERNPWDKAVSRYWWQKQRWEEKGRSGFPNISDYLSWLECYKPHWITNWGHYTIYDKLAVERMLFYENLTEDLISLADVLGVDREVLQLPKHRAKSGFRNNQLSYRDELTANDRDRITRICKNEINEFGYVF